MVLDNLGHLRPTYVNFALFSLDFQLFQRRIMLKVENVKGRVAFKRSSRPKLTVRGLTEVFGVGRTTYWKWYQEGRFDGVTQVDTKNGTLFDMREIFHLAYPDEDDRTIAVLMLQFRQVNGGRRVIK